MLKMLDSPQYLWLKMLNFDNVSGLKIYLKFQQKAIPDNLSLCKLIILHKST